MAAHAEVQEFNWKPWVVALLLALFWHAAWLLPRIPWTRPLPPPRVEVKTIDPKKLEAIRRKWDHQQLLLDKDKSPGEKVAPKDARYFSDKNRTVEKEQRAKETTLLPKPGGPQAHPKAKQAKPQHQYPSLGNLGIPLPKPVPKSDDTPGRAGPVKDPGGDQWVKDPNVPEGSENLLNSQESVFYSFYARLYEEIAPIWQSRLHEIPPRKILEGDYTTVVDVVFDKDGTLVGIERSQTSGVDDFDRAVNDAWRRVGRFPNPPHALLDAQGQVHTGWSFTVRIRGGFPLEFMPPERSY
jgi:hypothetical protein